MSTEQMNHEAQNMAEQISNELRSSLSDNTPSQYTTSNEQSDQQAESHTGDHLIRDLGNLIGKYNGLTGREFQAACLKAAAGHYPAGDLEHYRNSGDVLDNIEMVVEQMLKKLWPPAVAEENLPKIHAHFAAIRVQLAIRK